jgi:signal transduction histidine kinase
MFSRLTIRTKLLMTVAFPLLAILALAGVAYPTFQTVKVNGPEYSKIRAAAELEADILPPDAYAIEAFLDAGLLVDASDAKRRKALVDDLARLEKLFRTLHTKWQGSLQKGDLLRTTMGDASAAGNRMFESINNELLPIVAQFSEKDGATNAQFGSLAKTIYRKRLLPLFESHQHSIDKSVALAKAKRFSLEGDTKSFISLRLMILGLSGLAAFILIFLVSNAISKSIRKPIKALTDSAHHTASNELPQTVARIQAGGEVDTDSVRSAFSSNTDEIGELARAFDSMHVSAVGLAAEQARIRRNVSDNLVNIGRRSQGLLKRNLSLLTKMENDERDSTKLEQLFRMDHLTTRMRRNAESILVLAGTESPKVWTTPMAIDQVIRASLGQIEAYDRVDLGNIDPCRVRGNPVGDISHVLAELLENATMFSPPTARVYVHGKQRVDGYLIVISDEGVGMTPEEFDRANHLLSNPAEFDREATKVLGHVVVGRIAARHRIRVRLTESATTGVAAQILLPRALLEDDAPIEQSPVVSRTVDALPQRPSTPQLVGSGPSTGSESPANFTQSTSSHTAPAAPQASSASPAQCNQTLNETRWVQGAPAEGAQPVPTVQVPQIAQNFEQGSTTAEMYQQPAAPFAETSTQAPLPSRVAGATTQHVQGHVQGPREAQMAAASVLASQKAAAAGGAPIGASELSALVGYPVDSSVAAQDPAVPFGQQPSQNRLPEDAAKSWASERPWGTQDGSPLGETGASVSPMPDKVPPALLAPTSPIGLPLSASAFPPPHLGTAPLDAATFREAARSLHEPAPAVTVPRLIPRNPTRVPSPIDSAEFRAIERVAAAPAAPVTPTVTAGGLTHRVRGAQLPDTTSASSLEPSQLSSPRDAIAVRSALSALQSGIRAGKSNSYGTLAETLSTHTNAASNSANPTSKENS